MADKKYKCYLPGKENIIVLRTEQEIKDGGYIFVNEPVKKEAPKKKKKTMAEKTIDTDMVIGTEE